jgi:hypothetical protein
VDLAKAKNDIDNLCSELRVLREKKEEMKVQLTNACQETITERRVVFLGQP